MGNLAVIPARGNSTRLPRKNIREFGGKPMIAWTIEAAINSGLFQDVVVSTEDWEIAGIAEDFGASVPFTRDLALADEYTPTSMVTLDAVEKLPGYVHVAQLLPSCPLRNYKDIQESFKAFVGSPDDSTISVSDYGWSNPWWAITNAGSYLFAERLRDRSQDLPDLYCPTGAVWWTRPETLQLYKTFYTPRTGYYVIPWMRGIDIDTMEDFEVADALRGIC